MTPFHHREVTALVADAWSVMEEAANEGTRKRAAVLLRQALDLIDPRPAVPTPPMPPVVVVQPAKARNGTGGDWRTPVESSRDEWWPSIRLCAVALDKSYAAIVRTVGGKQPTCAGRCLWRSKFRTREEFRAAKERAA